MYFREAISSILLMCAAFSCSSQENTQLEITLFNDCDTDSSVELSTLDHELFSLDYPITWDKDNEMKQGIDISSTDFPDSLQRGFMLSVVPFKEYYLKQNPNIDYHQFDLGLHNGYKAIHLIRNDLYPRKTDETVYWRSELKIVNEAESLIYIIVYGKRYDVSKAPVWCEFESIINSLKIKE